MAVSGIQKPQHFFTAHLITHEYTAANPPPELPTPLNSFIIFVTIHQEALIELIQIGAPGA
jgi:hypothetical protein